MEFWIQVGGGLPYPYLRSRSCFFAGDTLMDLHLQFGFGMMSHTRELLEQWGGGTVILSPRDLTREQLQKLSKDVLSRNGTVLFDPQCFVREADHERLTSHEYFAEFQSYTSAGFRDGPGIPAVLSKLAAIGRELGVAAHILPGLMASRIGDAWFANQEAIIEGAPKHYGEEPIWATLAISTEALLDEGQIESLVERARAWDIGGFYVVAESPSGYLVDNPVWLANLLILVSGLKLQNRKVVVGYCNHQMLCLAAAKVDAIASGTWLNVRAFSPDRFSAAEEGAISRRATWYYCPQALSEFKIPFLDIAKRMGILEDLKPTPETATPYASPLFTGVAPSSVEWGEQSAFRHYLCSLRTQAALATGATYTECVDRHTDLLLKAEQLITKLHNNGVFGQDRDFGAYFDVNRAAMKVFGAARGSQLRRAW